MTRRERAAWCLAVAFALSWGGREYQHAASTPLEAGDRVRYNPVGMLVPGPPWVVKEVYKPRPPKVREEYLIVSPETGESAVVTRSALGRVGLF